MNKLHARQHVHNMTKLRTAITHMLKSNPEKVEAYQAGDTKVLEFFVQQVTKETHATPQIVKQMLIEKMDPPRTELERDSEPLAPLASNS